MTRLILLLLALAFASPAFAQKPTAKPAAAPTNCLPVDPRPECQNGIFTPPGGSPVTTTSPISNEILTALNNLVDTSDAVAEASSIPGLQDPVGASCWQSFGGIAAVLKVHPMPLTGRGAADYEAARILHLGLLQICANPNCGSMWNDLQNVVNAINPMTLGMSLTSICAKVPVASTTAAQYTVPNFTPVPATTAAPAAK